MDGGRKGEKTGGKEDIQTLVAPHPITISHSFQNENILLSLPQFSHYSNHLLTFKQGS